MWCRSVHPLIFTLNAAMSTIVLLHIQNASSCWKVSWKHDKPSLACDSSSRSIHFCAYIIKCSLNRINLMCYSRDLYLSLPIRWVLQPAGQATYSLSVWSYTLTKWLLRPEFRGGQETRWCHDQTRSMWYNSNIATRQLPWIPFPKTVQEFSLCTLLEGQSGMTNRHNSTCIWYVYQ